MTANSKPTPPPLFPGASGNNTGGNSSQHSNQSNANSNLVGNSAAQSQQPAQATPAPQPAQAAPAPQPAQAAPAPQPAQAVPAPQQATTVQQPVVPAQQAPVQQPVMPAQQAPVQQPVMPAQQAPVQQPVMQPQAAPAPQPADPTNPSGEAKPPANFRIGDHVKVSDAVKIPPNELQFNEEEFLRLLAASVSLKKHEKLDIINRIPKLKQFQINELMRIFKSESDKFAELPKEHTPYLQKLVKEKQAEWESIEDQFMMEGAKDSEKNQADEIRKQLGL